VLSAAFLAALTLGRLVLAPDGVYHRSQTFEHFVPWHAMSGVVAVAGRIPILVIDAYIPAPASGCAG
jgi:hypothetical protein